MNCKQINGAFINGCPIIDLEIILGAHFDEFAFCPVEPTAISAENRIYAIPAKTAIIIDKDNNEISSW